MLGKIMAALGRKSPPPAAPAEPVFHQPYAQAHVNAHYNLLFCDNYALFAEQPPQEDHPLWHELTAHAPKRSMLNQIAQDAAEDGRLRALACHRLREIGAPTPRKLLLGVIVEAQMQHGLDVLAAFADGGVRYLSQSGKVSIFDGPGNPLEVQAKDLVGAAQTLLNKLGPWHRPRLAPPPPGNIRITFVVSDGLYFGQGAFATLQQDVIAGPILAKTTKLLQQVVEPEN
ncbi:hypothetical protein V8J88_08290 [Massilia sp. W12]|uniref:hypothetical protein n=1 Tax=Massilia sp. W12 TaxID=3126507 RepID=UPI0030CBA32A